jgi:pantoate--beta-alanine ligase
MLTITTTHQMHAAVADFRKSGRTVGFVPTMGALHEGHLSLVRKAEAQCDIVAVSIFVNPMQFGPNEDLAKYPRPFERDRALLETEGVQLLFAPTVEEIYPAGATTFVDVEGLSERLDGKSRPGHFRGVTTIVAKLFNIVAPHRAYFGQKDAAQVAVIRKMVRDLLFPVEIVVGPIIREADGLALSSRNVYLSAEERAQSLVLRRSLDAVEEAFCGGQTDPSGLREVARRTFAAEPAALVDYVELVDPDTLEPIIGRITSPALCAVAVHIGSKPGSTRLIDNTVLHPRK